MGWLDSTRNGLLELFSLASLFQKTRQILADYLSGRGEVPAEGVQFLAEQAIPHVEDIRQGFKWSLRASDAGIEELRYLVSFDLPVKDEVDRFYRYRLIEPEVRSLRALYHSKVVFGSIPRLPSEQVSYPGRRDYSDILAPRSPAELSERIDELERALWDVATRRPVEWMDLTIYRRVYGFFETGAWLDSYHLRLLARGADA